ncbi:phospho-sugar mutase [Salinicoccus sp. ID82-1]|uniref:phospho-sugar mutase n=1 Tax=Salinicoccus sp. ID82-1 TaxID=2820269 RepID=UPI001F1DE733|nr:phospho-sugar mutase [Salinicoccus sp. ID82-1]MCG1008662.1 phospho-sugar mutase [Salinicoccus sp. ID82-1]
MDRKQWEDNIEGSFITAEAYDALSEEEKEDAYRGTLSFGTAGIRGKIGLGPNRLNRYNVEKVALGLAHALEGKEEPLVVIGYDTRHFSPEFAETMTSVLVNNDVSVRLSERYISTPELSFHVREHGADFGVMITASHNPPEYNGIKVYGPDGAQLIDAPAAELSEKINAIEDIFNIDSTPFDEALDSGKAQYIEAEMEESYRKRITAFIPEIPSSDLKVVFSSLHGTSVPIVPEMLDTLGFSSCTLVEDQCKPDGDFPSIKSPNPESVEAFEESRKLGTDIGADVLIATDPDADRIGLQVLHEGEYIHLNGNQLGVLLLDHRLKKHEGSTPVVIKSIVTSDLGRKIAEDRGAQMIEVLTGFKYIGEQIKNLEDDQEHQFILGYEESYGYLLEPFVRDKDAIQIVPYIISMASELKNDGKTLVDALEAIYEKYGRRMEVLYSHTFEGASGKEKIEDIMTGFRNDTPDEIEGRKVIMTEDFKTQERSYSDGNTESIDLPEANVIKIHFEDGWIALRPSGTEPKIKLYVSLDSEDIEAEAKSINEMIFEG